jgi:hypothetical protein
MRKTVAEAMAGRTVTLTTVEVGGETEQVGGSGRHVDEERCAGNVGINSRRGKRDTTRFWRLVQAIVMLAPAGRMWGFRLGRGSETPATTKPPTRCRGGLRAYKSEQERPLSHAAATSQEDRRFFNTSSLCAYFAAVSSTGLTRLTRAVSEGSKAVAVSRACMSTGGPPQTEKIWPKR